MKDFDYLSERDVYLDSACQSLRPRPVIDALNHYYTEHNSCGERVKYAWGKRTDELVEDTRAAVLKYLKLKPKNFSVSFTLNTTYGINLLLQQLRAGRFKKVICSDIEHNSPFLSTMTFARKHQIPREVIERNPDGSIDVDRYDFTDAVVVVNCVSNVDGRKLHNINQLIKKIHAQNGIIIVDAAQALAHSPELLYKTDADAVCSSAHKMYGPSLGVIIVKRKLLDLFETSFIGGGMVDDVTLKDYTLSAASPNHAYTKFEPGLQAWGEIIAFGAAIKWLSGVSKQDKNNFTKCYERLYEYLRDNPKIKLVNQVASPTLSFYIDSKSLNSHLVGDTLSGQGIMARTGYFCVHYYLDHKMQLPPLVRFSLGYHNRMNDIEKTIATLERITK